MPEESDVHLGSSLSGRDLEQTHAIWDRIAAWWDNALGEGNEFQKTLIMPATDRLLGPLAGQTIVDIACGNGNYSRRLGRGGAEVVACDFSEQFLQCARRRTTGADGRIKYSRIDATDSSQLLSLGQGRFDAVVCSMAMMDMPTIEPLLNAMPRLLKPAGRFVFSLPHPCFNSNHARMTAELINESGRMEQLYGVSIQKYLLPTTDLSSGILNQPEPHYLFHRPLSEIFSGIFRAGLIVDGFEEPAYSGAGGGGKNAFSWVNRPEIPPAIVLRARPRPTHSF